MNCTALLCRPEKQNKFQIIQGVLLKLTVHEYQSVLASESFLSGVDMVYESACYIVLDHVVLHRIVSTCFGP